MKFLVIFALFITAIFPSSAFAQSSEDPWADPLNLSHSGISVNPAIVSDSEGVVHALWQDDLENYIYTSFDGKQWSTPVTTELDSLFRLPVVGDATVIYTGPNPLLLAGPGQYTFAFWISAQGRLLTSRVENSSFGSVAAWGSGRQISPEAASFAVAIDPRGEWHLAFVRTLGEPDNPAGIYYISSKGNGLSWAQPKLLYESPYLRTLSAGEANISLVTTGTEDNLNVFVAWDNRPRKQVLLAKSTDGGENWDEPILIAGPEPASGQAGPFNIHVGALQKSVVLVWQNGRPEGGCSLMYQSSGDTGTSWSNPQPMIEGLLGCPHSNEFMTGSASIDGPLFLLTETQSEVYLTAWNGLQWSQPEVQPILTGFEDPEIYTEVTFGCHRATLDDTRLYIVGCDLGGGGDIWVTSRDLGSNASWFSAPVWNQVSPVADSNLKIEAIEMVATDDNLIHIFFSQRQDTDIYYTFWDGAVWSHITPVLRLADEEASWPVITVGPGNELFLVAPTQSGAVYYNRAISGDAGSESRWSKPTRLALDQDGEVGLVDVAWDSSGTLYMAYSVPVNEKRGVYLIQSRDHGESWSIPLQVFNGAAAGFDLVGGPSLLISANDTVHIIWKEHSIQEGQAPQPTSLYYTRSEDSGLTFSKPEPIVEEPVSWQEIVADDQGNLHLLWQDTMATVWDQISLDNGHTWEFPQGLPYEGATATTMVDSAGRLHLIDAGSDSLGHWLWDGSRWNAQTSLHWSLASQQENPVNRLSAAVNKLGEMVVVLAVPTGTDNSGEETLLYSTRNLKLPPNQSAVVETPSETLLPATLPPATATQELISTPTRPTADEQANSQDPASSGETSNGTSPLTIALLPVALLLLGVLGFVIRRATRNDER